MLIKFSKIIILIGLLSGFTFAQNTNDVLRVAYPGLGSNARALGMGNAYIGLSDDASAMYFNPAGLGFLKRMEFSGGLNYYNYDNNISFFGNTSSYNNSSTNLNRLSFAFPFPTLRGSLVFGLSYHQNKDLASAVKFDGFNPSSTAINFFNKFSDIPYELFLTDDNFNTFLNDSLQQSGDILNEGSINNWTLSGAIEVYRNIFVGANLNIISGSYESVNDFYEDDILNIYQGVTAPGEPQTTDFKTFHLNRILRWDISGWDAKLGMIYQLEKSGRIGFTIQFPKTYAINEEFLVDAESQFGTGQIYRINSEDFSDKVEFDIITPFEFSGGFSINFAGVILSAEGTFTDYSQTKFKNEDGLSASFISERNKEIKSDLGTVFRYNAGLEYTIPAAGLRLRTGYLAQPSAYRNDPSNFDKKYLTFGAGFLADNTIGIDFAYSYGWWDDYGDNYGTGESRTIQNIKAHNLMLTATYRF